MLTRLIRGLYMRLPGRASTQLAISPVGRALFALMSGGSGRGDVWKSNTGLRFCLPREDALNSGLVLMGEMCPLETRFLRSRMTVGGAMVDVGTYRHGWFAMNAAQIAGPGGRVVAFEPNPESFAELQYNVALNGYGERIRCFRAAASAANGAARFDRHGPQSSITEAGEWVVETRAVDAMSGNWPSIDVLKSDSEGHELQVLMGAEATLRRTRAVILEVHTPSLARHGTTPAQVCTFLEERGFACYGFRRSGKLAPCSAAEPKSDTFNMAFIRKG